MERQKVLYFANNTLNAVMQDTALVRLGVQGIPIEKPAEMVPIVEQEPRHLCVLWGDEASLDVARQLKQLAYSKRPKVLMLIDLRNKELFQRVLEANVDSWQFLPCSNQEIIKAILTVLGRKQTDPMLAPVAVRLASPSEADGWAVNIDDRGCVLACDLDLELNVSVALQLQLPSESIWLNGRVAQIDTAKDGKRYILRFFDTSDRDRWLLATFEAVNIYHWGATSIIELRYPLTGDLDLEAHFKDLKPTVVFDLSEVERINSMGVSRWIEMLRALDKVGHKEIFFVRCSWAFIHSALMVPAFQGKGKVLSAFLPYSCEECSTEHAILIDLEREQMDHPPLRFCPYCTSTMSTDLEDYDLSVLHRGS